LRGAAAGGDLRGGDAAGDVQRLERVVDLAGGLVVLQGSAELAAGQPVGVLAQDGVDLFGERLAGRAAQCPGRGSGGVVLERERGGQVLVEWIWRWPSVRA
jgi:hypothetical protein